MTDKPPFILDTNKTQILQGYEKTTLNIGAQHRTTPTEEIVKRLRKPWFLPIHCNTMTMSFEVQPRPEDLEAASLIESQQEEIKRLKEALNGIYNAYMELTYDMPVVADASVLEAARAALNGDVK